MRTTPDCIVIGAGINSLVCAAELAKGGRRVLVLEAREVVGGSYATEDIAPGYRCDLAQLDVGWVPPKLASRLALGSHGFRVAEGSARVTAFASDGAPVVLGVVAETVASLRARGSPPGDSEKYPEFVSRMRPIRRFLESLYGQAAPELSGGSFADFVRIGGAGLRLRAAGSTAVVDLLRALPMSAADLLEEWFTDDVLRGALAASGVTGLHQGPGSAGTSFLLLHREVGAPARHFGARPSAVGGAGALAGACAAAARAAGADIRLGAAVRRVVIEREKVGGVELENGEMIAARMVISGADPRRTMLGLVDPYWLPPEYAEAVSHVRHRGCVMVIRLALSEAPRIERSGEGALLGALRVAGTPRSMERAADAVKYGALSGEPWVEMRVPSVHDPSLAPPGHHVAIVRAQYAPYALAGGWTSAKRDVFADAALARLEAHVSNLRGAIVQRDVLAPPDLEQRLGVSEGDVDHGAMMLDQILFMRPVAGWARYRTPVDGLYLCSAGTHPGAGLPGVPGLLAARAAQGAPAAR